MTFVLSNAKNSSYTFREGEGKKTVETIVPGVTQVQDSSEHKKEEDKESDQNFHEIFSQNTIDCQSDTMSTKGGLKSKMLVSIGSGVSMIKVANDGTFERVSGTMIGGGTLVGLSNLLTGIKDFDTIIEMS